MNSLTKKVEGISLSTVLERVKYSTGMDDDMLEKAEKLYRQYLHLRAKYPNEIIVPPRLADECWHAHILDSQQYVSDCQSLFGNYLHHHQGDAVEVITEGWQNSQRLYNKEFGVDLVAGRYKAAECR